MRIVQRLVTVLCVLGLVVAGCGGDDTIASDGAGDDSSTSEPAGDDDATSSEPALQADAAVEDEDAEESTASTEEEIAAACSAYCVFETQTCPDTADDADNDTAACEAACMDPANASGLSGSAADSEACYLQTSAYFTCLQGLSCEDFDAHWAGLNSDPDYVDSCTETLADDACE
ncbi:MAG: hypothetical protein ACPGU1_08270 [Myxococcota bacterium]